ncbi:NUDIX hydrolase [Arthrobacter sp. ISL-48]|uniref:NUDIX hydrolase n=1 Tax=Arthrobacter sp. ISL-48 TaxID=2819110 RepID=UPI00288B1A90|nr:NUDIX hydrolase [Arthrobacter sp. ISL-48]
MTDGSGNELLAIERITEDELDHRDPAADLPLSLVVVTHAGKVLMIFNRWREQWELPGGMIESDETPRQAAFRELAEETGIFAQDLNFEARTLFSLRRPDRLEYAAVYSTRLGSLPELTENEEATAFLWWTPTTPVEDNTSPLDAAIASRTACESHPEAAAVNGIRNGGN